MFLDFLKYKDSDKVAVICGDEKITYRKLYEKVLFYSKAFECDFHAVIVYGTTLNSLISIISLLFAKRTYIPVGVCTPLDRLNEIIKSTKANLIVSDVEIPGVDIEVRSLSEIECKKNIKRVKNNKTAYIILRLVQRENLN